MKSQAPSGAVESVLGVDLGSSRIKVTAYDRMGVSLATVAITTPATLSPAIDFPVLHLLDAVNDAISRLELAGPVVGVGIGSMGEVGTVLSRDGLRDLSFPAWYDDRGADVVELVGRELGFAELDARTGGHGRTVSTLAKLGWLARQGTPLDGTFLGLAGALVWRLTGAVLQESSLACTSGAFEPWDRTWWRDPWEAAGLSAVALPELQPVGGWSPATGPTAERWGLVPGCPVLVAGHDHLVAAVGSGARVGDVVDSLGTGEPVIAVAPSDRLGTVADVAALVSRGMTVECWPPTGTATVAFEGLRPGLAMETFLRSSGIDRAELDRAAPGAREAVPLDAKVVADLEAGLSGPAGPADWGALLDHYARRASEGDQLVRAATGAQGPTLVTGGGTRSARWLAAKAAWSQRPLRIVLTQETAARGAAAMAGAAAGWWADAADMPGLELLTTDKTGRVSAGQR